MMYNFFCKNLYYLLYLLSLELNHTNISAPLNLNLTSSQAYRKYLSFSGQLNVTCQLSNEQCHSMHRCGVYGYYSIFKSD